MSTLFRNLRSIYDNKPSLEVLNPFDETYLLLRDFLFDYIDNNSDYLDPYDYALKYRKDIMKTLNLFLTLSENNLILIKHYYIECDACGNPTIASTLEQAYDCTHCRAPLDLTEEIYNNFKNIHYIFKINRDIRKELIHDLKDQPSFSSKSEEEGIQSSTSKNPSLFDVIETNHLKDSALELEKQKLSKLFLNYIEGSS